MMKKTTLLLGVALSLAAWYPDVPSKHGVYATGAPLTNTTNETTCASCHSGGSYGASARFALTDASGAAITQYLPNTLYTVTLTMGNTVALGTRGGYGFQAVALKTTDRTTAGTFSSAGTGITLSNRNNRNYAEQSAKNTSKTFTWKWTSPAANSGTVTFYASGLVVNGTGGTSGDQNATTSLSLPEGKATALETETPETQVLLFPNPTQNQLSIWLGAGSLPVSQIEVYDVTGRLVWQHGSTTNNMIQIPTQAWTSGLYVLRMQYGQVILNKTFIKQ